MLSDNTSALRLAQNLGADFILIPSITTYGTEKKTYSGDGINTINVVHNLRVSYKIVEAGAGGAVKGGTAMASKTIRQSDNLQVESNDVINELLDDAAGQLADSLVRNAGSLPAEVAKDKQVNFSIVCSMTDVGGEPMTVPDLRVTDDNRVLETNKKLQIEPMDVTVELDGVTIGSAPGAFQAYPGLHKLRLSREGFQNWERTINIYNQQTLKVALQMTDAGYARWKDVSLFIWRLTKDQKLTDAAVRTTDANIKNKGKLTDAAVRTTDAAIQNDSKLTDAQIERERILAPGELEVLKGQAQMLRQSGYKVDTKENVKIYNSIY